ncbi:MAG: Fic family protein [Candidatus Izemoplasmatales bacterium]
MTYKPPYEITNRMLNQIASIMKLVGQFTASIQLDKRPLLRRTNKVRSIYSSLAIENNRLTENQVQDIINGKLVIGPQKDILEVKNAIKVYDQIQNINPFRENDILKYHGIMMESLIPDAGKYRIGQVGVLDGDKVIFIAPPSERVPSLMRDLYEYLNEYEENILIKSSVFHYEFEIIHPFSDGNGRMGRLFQTCLLSSEEEIFTFLPIESIIKQHQQKYYDTISACNKEGNSNRFIEFMLDAIQETLMTTLNMTNEVTSWLSIQARKLYELMEVDVPYTRQELMNQCEIKSIASFKKNYIDPLLDSNLIEMTIPDKPNSRNQRYVKKKR